MNSSIVRSVVPSGFMPEMAHSPKSEEIGWLVRCIMTAQVPPPPTPPPSKYCVIQQLQVFVLGLFFTKSTLPHKVLDDLIGEVFQMRVVMLLSPCQYCWWVKIINYLNSEGAEEGYTLLFKDLNYKNIHD